VKIALWKSRDAKVIMIRSVTGGVVVGCFYLNARGFRGLVSVYQNACAR
jgi:hypothetical protein